MAGKSADRPFAIEYSQEAINHLRKLNAFQQRAVLDGVDTHLGYQPTQETRNRRPMRPNPLAPWELRLGVLRVYFEVQEIPRRLVLVRAVGLKQRDEIWIGGEHLKL